MKKTFVIFILVGIVQYLLDTAIFSFFILYIDTEFANIISRFSGACIGYYINGYVTFSVINRSNAFDLRRIAKFALVWAGLTLISTVLIHTAASLSNGEWHYTIGIKMVVEALLIVFSFTLQRLFVYNKNSLS